MGRFTCVVLPKMSQHQTFYPNLLLNPRARAIGLLWLGVSGLLLLIGVGWGITTRIGELQRQENERIDSYQAVLRQTNQMYQAAVDAETGIRGYLLTRRPESLAPYYEGQTSFTHNLALTRQVGNLASNPRLAQIERSFQHWQARFGQPVIDSRGDAAALERLSQSTLAGKQLFDPLRQEIGQFRDEQREILYAQRARARATQSSLWLGNHVRTLLVSLGVLALALALHRSLRRLLKLLEERGQTITALQQAQTETQAALNRLEKANAELDSFVYSASHDLREPLRSLEAFSGFLLEDLGPRLEAQETDYLQRIIAASQRMRRLISDLLLLSRIGRQTELYSRVDLNRVLSEVLLEFEVQIQERHVQLIQPAKLPIITGNATELASIFRNLLGNALKFSPVPYPNSQGPQVEVGCSDQAKEYLFWVRDWGIGIDPNYHEKIFGLFQRLRRREEFEGTGAGLAIVRKGVSAHGGRIWVESQPNLGSTFFFTLPRLTPEPTLSSPNRPLQK